MSLGIWEVLAIIGIALLFFGPSRLPGLGRSLGETMRGFKQALDTKDDTEKSKPPVKDDSSDDTKPQA